MKKLMIYDNYDSLDQILSKKQNFYSYYLNGSDFFMNYNKCCNYLAIIDRAIRFNRNSFDSQRLYRTRTFYRSQIDQFCAALEALEDP